MISMINSNTFEIKQGEKSIYLILPPSNYHDFRLVYNGSYEYFFIQSVIEDNILCPNGELIKELSIHSIRIILKIVKLYYSVFG